MPSFAEFCADFYKKYFDLHPTEAIDYGIEGYDHLLKDFGDESYLEEKAFVQGSLKQLRQLSVKGLTKDETIDYALLEGSLTIENYEFNKEDYRLKLPDLYLPVSHIYDLTVRPTNDLMGNTMSRLGQFPQVINQGIVNLSRQEANPPRLWTEMAIEEAKGSISFLDNLTNHPKVKEGVKDPKRFNQAVDLWLIVDDENAPVRDHG